MTNEQLIAGLTRHAYDVEHLEQNPVKAKLFRDAAERLGAADNLALAVRETVTCDRDATDALKRIGIGADTSLTDMLANALTAYTAAVGATT